MGIGEATGDDGHGKGEVGGDEDSNGLSSSKTEGEGEEEKEREGGEKKDGEKNERSTLICGLGVRGGPLCVLSECARGNGSERAAGGVG